MPTNDTRKTIYRESRAHTGLNKRQWGRLFALGRTRNSHQVVGHKENPAAPGPDTTSKGVNMPEALAAQLLVFLHDQGFDIEAVSFDEEGRVQTIPRKTPSSARPSQGEK